jgi:guanine deaminase
MNYKNICIHLYTIDYLILKNKIFFSTACGKIHNEIIFQKTAHVCDLYFYVVFVTFTENEIKNGMDFQYMDEAFRQAYQSIRNNIGGPFGAVVVKNGRIIGKGGNRVLTDNDPTAHAEVVAIREACSALGTFDLTGSVLYATCEPCPMCLSAIYWANIGEVWYCSTRYDAEAIGFKDNHIYEEIGKVPEGRDLPFHRVQHPQAAQIFEEWKEKEDKQPY